MKILGLSGSLRSESHNTRLLRGAGGLLPAGTEFELFDGLADIPPYSEDAELEPTPAAVAAFKAAIAGADAILVATPEYNGSIPGTLKNALDWASRPRAETPLAGKPAAVVGASTGMFGAVWAQAEVRKVLAASGANVRDEELPVGHADQAFDGQGRLAVPEMQAQLREIVSELVAQAEQLALAAR